MENLQLFNEHVDYEGYIGSEDAIFPNVSYCEDLECVHYNFERTVPVGQPDNEIWYTTLSGVPLDLSRYDALLATTQATYGGPEIISNTYENGKGIIKFAEPLTKVGVWQDNMDCFYCFCLPDIGPESDAKEDAIVSVEFPKSVREMTSSELRFELYPGEFRTEIVGCFFYSRCLENVVFKTESMDTICDYAFFYCREMKHFDFPSNVHKIGDCAFFYTGLESIEFPSNLDIIGNSAFCNTNIVTADIPNSVGRMGLSAFESCVCLKNLTLPISLQTIPAHAFYNCSRLQNVELQQFTRVIEEGAFAWCCAMKNIDINDALERIDNAAFLHCCSLSALTFPDDIEYCGDYVLQGCTSLLSFTIPNNFSGVPSGMFSECESLSSVTIPNGVQSLGQEVFEKCKNLKGIELPSSVTTLGNGVFRDCYSLESMTIPSGVTVIPPRCFDRCSALTEVYLPATITRLGSSAFYECKSLRSLALPPKITTIDGGTFYFCQNLETVVISNSVYQIGFETFKKCVNLRNVIMLPTYRPPQHIGDMFTDCPNITIYVPYHMLRQYRDHIYYGNYNVQYLPVGKTEIWYTTNDNMPITIDDSTFVPNLVSNTYENGLGKLTFDGDVDVVGAGSFSGQTTITNLYPPRTTNTIGDYAFYGCTSLKNGELTDFVSNVGERAFYGCTGLEMINIFCGEPPVIQTETFDNTNNCRIYVPRLARDTYCDEWPNYSSRITYYS